jgi:hypothetical protein
MHATNDSVEQVVLLHDGAPAANATNVAKLLRFFGLPWRSLTVAEFRNVCSSEKGVAKFRLISSSDAFLRLIDRVDETPASRGRWWECVHSVFVHGQDGPASLRALAARLTDHSGVRVVELANGPVIVTDRMEAFCGIMSGLRIALTSRSDYVSALFGLLEGSSVISIETGSVFARLDYHQLPVFLSTAKTIVDLEMELETGIFDLRDHLLSSLPIVLYIKWGCPITGWNSAETNACLVIDDPVLKRSHGFVDFAELLSLMKRYRFSTNIAFIPWNWRRSDQGVVNLFIENPDSYSLSVHGCDHTRAEFGSANLQQLTSKISRALERMDSYERRTGIRHDRVMVFPQGVFSTAAMTALKHTELIAAVNNDTISADPCPRPITIADVWNVAVMKYDNFPLFTRRYPWEGLGNLAFDTLLGKPVIILIHHDSCRDHCTGLTDFIDQFNALKSAPAWRGLGEVVKRSCRQRRLSENAVEVEMYASELRLDNHSDREKEFRVRKTEFAPSSIRNIRIASQSVGWNVSDGWVSFELKLGAGESAVVSVEYNDLGERRPKERDIIGETRTMLRRYLCEVRDNYVIKYKLILKSALGGNGDHWI